MTTLPTPVALQVEDTTFPFGGYWKGTATDLLCGGDGVRLTADPILPCLLVESATECPEGIMLFLSIRSVHIANLITDIFHRPQEGISEDAGLHCLILPADHPVWIRL